MTNDEKESLLAIIKDKKKKTTFNDSHENVVKNEFFNQALDIASGIIIDVANGNVAKEYIKVLKEMEL